MRSSLASDSIIRRDAIVIVLASVATLLASVPLYASGMTSYEEHVRPIFKTHCFHCHGEEGIKKAGVDLRLHRSIMAGGKNGAIIVPGNRKGSLLYELVASGEMPEEEGKALSPQEVETIGRWLDEGAQLLRAEPLELNPDEYITLEERSHWAFQPIHPVEPPSIRQPSLVVNEVDTFLLNRLDREGLDFSEKADLRTLLRRVYFDLVGLPPTPGEVAEFIHDPTPDAYDKLVDRLLASPHYGERWGRHWLDVAGYADSEGYNETDSKRPFAYRYRDYVIESFNRDKPFDQFLIEQLAGDELVGGDRDIHDPDVREKLVATGFLRMAPDGTGTSNADQDLARNQVVTETIKIVSSAFLGLTMGCAECHDHRFDPILQKDYYAMRAFFEPALDWKDWRKPSERRLSLYTSDERREAEAVEQEARLIDAEFRAREKEVQEKVFQLELVKIPAEQRKRAEEAYRTPRRERTPEQETFLKDEYPNVNVGLGSALDLYLELFEQGRQWQEELKAIKERASKIRERKPREEFIRVLTEEAKPELPKTLVFYRGDYGAPRHEVQPAGLSVLNRVAPFESLDIEPLPSTSGRRLALAKYLVNGKHPLTARVIVNRIWLHHFGRGLVNSPGDFGVRGEPPSHPELLDWLAHDFMEKGWKIKRLHKLIVTSRAYQQASRRHTEGDQVDRDNRLLWRMPVKRLEAELVRDAILSASGRLSSRVLGRPMDVSADQNNLFVISGEDARRSVYAQVLRTKPMTLLQTFDSPAMEPNCEFRSFSTVTPQALSMMNSEFVLQAAKHFAQRLQGEAVGVADQVKRAWLIAYAKEPTAQQIQLACDYINRQRVHFQETDRGENDDKKSDPEILALATFCQIMIASNQFLYID